MSGLTILYRMTGNSQNFARIKLGIKLISDSVKVDRANSPVPFRHSALAYNFNTHIMFYKEHMKISTSWHFF